MISRRIKALILTMALLCLPLCACDKPEAPAGAQVEAQNEAQIEVQNEAQAEAPATGTWYKISAEEAKQLMSESEGGYIILDVRTEEEYTEGHIEGAYLIPYDEAARLAESSLCEPDTIVFVYCRSGRRSAAAAEILAGIGFTNVYDIGGITSWPYGTVTGAPPPAE